VLLHPAKKTEFPTATGLDKLVSVPGSMRTVPAAVLAQGAWSAMKDSVRAFRHMRDVLTGGYAHVRP
jgi:hypothetical protein